MDAVTEWAVGPGHYTTHDGKPPDTVSRGRGRGRGRGVWNGRGRGRGGKANPRADGHGQGSRNESPGHLNQASTATNSTTTHPKQETNRQNIKNKSVSNRFDSSKSVPNDLVNGTSPTSSEPVVHGTSLSSQLLDTQMAPRKNLFFTLPGELRTKIYDYVFGQYRVEIIRGKWTVHSNQKQPVYYRLYHRNLRLRNLDNYGLIDSCSKSPPMALVRTSSQIWRETLLYVYSNTHFVFRSSKVIKMFLNRVSEDAQREIRHIELDHTMYYEPELTEHRRYKLVSDVGWYSTCFRMSLAFNGLKSLHLDLDIGDWPIHLETREQWALPYRFFKNLDYVKVHLTTSFRIGWFGRKFRNPQLWEAARQLEKEMMDETAWQIKEHERIARNLSSNMRYEERLKDLDVIQWDTDDHFS